MPELHHPSLWKSEDLFYIFLVSTPSTYHYYSIFHEYYCINSIKLKDVEINSIRLAQSVLTLRYLNTDTARVLRNYSNIPMVFFNEYNKLPYYDF